MPQQEPYKIFKREAIILYIVKIRPLTMRELNDARLLKPFEDKGLVKALPKGLPELRFLSQLLSGSDPGQKDFSDILNKTHTGMTPTEIYNHLVARDEYIPTLYLIHEGINGKVSKASVLTSKMLQEIAQSNKSHKEGAWD